MDHTQCARSSADDDFRSYVPVYILGQKSILIQCSNKHAKDVVGHKNFKISSGKSTRDTVVCDLRVVYDCYLPIRLEAHTLSWFNKLIGLR